MLDSPIFNVGIGLALVYLVLSLIVTSISQLIGDAMSLKAKQLRLSIANMLGENLDQLKRGERPDLLDKFYASPFVGHFRKPGKTKKGSDPERLDSASFLPAMEEAIEKKYSIKNLPDLLQLATKVKTNASDALAAAEKLEQTEGAQLFLQTDLGKTLVSHYTKAERDIQAGITNVKDSAVQFEQHVEDWYDSTTEKARGWYRAHMRRISLVIAIFVVLLFNADTLRIAASIWNSDGKESAITALATRYIEGPRPEAATAPSGDATVAQVGLDVKQLEADLDAFNEVIDQADLPIGWHKESLEYFYTYEPPKSADGEADESAPKSLKINFLNIFKAILGWTVTAFALSLGAPFWYDALKRVIQVRSTVKRARSELAAATAKG